MDADDIPDPEPLPELDDTQIQPTNNQFELRLLSQVNKWAALDSFSFEPNEQVVCGCCCGYCLLLAVLSTLLSMLLSMLLLLQHTSDCICSQQAHSATVLLFFTWIL